MNIAYQLINENHRNKIILSTKPSFLGLVSQRWIIRTFKQADLRRRRPAQELGVKLVCRCQNLVESMTHDPCL